MAYFRCTTGGSGKGNTLVVTCADDLAGATITCTDGTKTYTKTCPSTSPYEVTFYGLEAGTWTVSAIVSGNTYTTTVVITDYEAELGGFSWKNWVNLSENYASSDFTDLDDLLSDETAVRELMTIHACVDYLAGIAAESPDVETIIGNDLCAKWINNRDYALDTLYANEIIADYMDTADKYFYGEWVITDNTTTPPTWGAKGNVPVMTANDAPYGTASARTEQPGYYAYMAFSGNLFTPIGSSNHGYATNNAGTSEYLRYAFTNPIMAKKAYLNWSLSNGATAQIQGSNDGSTWVDVSEVISMANSETSAEVDIDTDGKYYLQYQLKILSGNWYYGYGIKMQYYGRELSVSVPVMSGDTTPYGTASTSSAASSSYAAFKVFDGDNSTYWRPEAGHTNNYVQYDFTKPICVQQFYAYVTCNISVTMHVSLQGSNTGNSNDWHIIGDTSTISTTGGYTFNAANDTAYRYYRFFVPESIHTSGVGACDFKTLQFYGLDYSEREFEEGTTKKWLYDHGVKVVDFGSPIVTGSPTVIDSDNQIGWKLNPSATNFIAFMPVNGMDLTSYSLMRCKIGNIAIIGNSQYGNIGVKATRSYSSSDNTLISQRQLVASDVQYPNTISLDISSVSQTAYPILCDGTSGDNRGCTFKELWLE